MTTLLFGLIAATSLAAAGVAAPSEIRSAQSLPNDNLVRSTTSSDPAGKLHNVSRMADGGANAGWDHTDKSQCDAHHWNWDFRLQRCHKNVLPLYLIGAGTTGGIIYALTSRDGSSSNQSPISH